MSETRDFIDSADFSVVLRSCLDKLFAHLSESLGHLFVDDNASPASQAAQRRFIEVSEKKVRLAAVLPALARASHTIFNGVPNEYAEALADNRELMEFSVVVYSNFQQQ
jgi:peroxin-3